MGNTTCKTTPEMMQARQLLRENPEMYGAEVARQVGLSRSAIHLDSVCRELLAGRTPGTHRINPKVLQARVLLEQHVLMSGVDVARQVGVSHVTIYRDAICKGILSERNPGRSRSKAA